MHVSLASAHFGDFGIVRMALEYGFARTKIVRQAPAHTSGGDLLSSLVEWQSL